MKIDNDNVTREIVDQAAEKLNRITRKALTRSVRWHLALWHLRCALDHLRAILRRRR